MHLFSKMDNTTEVNSRVYTYMHNVSILFFSRLNVSFLHCMHEIPNIWQKMSNNSVSERFKSLSLFFKRAWHDPVCNSQKVREWQSRWPSSKVEVYSDKTSQWVFICYTLGPLCLCDLLGAKAEMTIIWGQDPWTSTCFWADRKQT